MRQVARCSSDLIRMAMIEKARREGKQYMNPVPTAVGGLVDIS